MGVTALFGRYHGLIREVASRGSPENAWRLDLEQVLRGLSDDCRKLPRSSGEMLCRELSDQIEHELLRSTSPVARSVLAVALKHLEPHT